VVTLDLTGEVCPYTFVKTKLALEELAPGEELLIQVDHAPAARNVPRSCQAEGHCVLSTAEVAPARWEIRVRKGGPPR
jgi:tRNA 2-thiouridine synthesizing protein A